MHAHTMMGRKPTTPTGREIVYNSLRSKTLGKARVMSPPRVTDGTTHTEEGVNHGTKSTEAVAAAYFRIIHMLHLNVYAISIPYRYKKEISDKHS